MEPDRIRQMFATAISQMYAREVPQYGALLEIVRDTNERVLRTDAQLRARLERAREVSRVSEERHGAIRLGTPAELRTMRRLFGVMGMSAVGYYDLSAGGLPVHATAFRPTNAESLRRNPFRVFTSLLRLDLIVSTRGRFGRGDEGRSVIAAVTCQGTEQIRRRAVPRRQRRERKQLPQCGND